MFCYVLGKKHVLFSLLLSDEAMDEFAKDRIELRMQSKSYEQYETRGERNKR